MIRFDEIIPDDLPQIGEWIEAEPDHKGKMTPLWWMQGTVLSCCAEDDRGPVMYLRIDREGDWARLHIQFGPQHQVSKLRVAGAFIEGIPRMADTMANYGFKALVFASTSDSLIGFMRKMGFVPSGGCDYLRSSSHEGGL